MKSSFISLHVPADSRGPRLVPVRVECQSPPLHQAPSPGHPEGFFSLRNEADVRRGGFGQAGENRLFPPYPLLVTPGVRLRGA